MKRFNTLLICFFTLFWVCLAAPRPKKLKTKEHFDPDNFNMANEAAKTANVDLEHGGFYAFLEKWQSHNSAEECASGFSHVRLVVGQYMNKQRKTLEGNAYDLIKDPAPVPKKIYGAPWDENVEDFWANHYFKAADEKTPGDKDGWLKASKANSYTYGGKVKPGIVKEGSNAQKARNDVKNYLSNQAQRIKENGQPYNIVGKVHGTNCISFAEALLDTIKEDEDKEKCE